ncbi:MAG: 1-acyl-sn-glycerol-3-phosphate acyltransferase [Clostridia bacterium]|nr:1-acyl-sn-glycerol-3-phosphate acyltransferase [Clostridia bacterium]
MNRNPSKFVLGFVKLTGLPGGLLLLRPKVYLMNKSTCKRKLPKGCILMSNHTSLMDFVLYLFVFFERNLRFLMAEVLFRKGKLFSWFLYKIGGIFVNRNTYDFSFVGESVAALEKGESIGIFPEARLPVNGKSHSFKPSVAMIALQSGAPIIPVYTNGCYFKLSRARVMIGEPIYVKDLVAENETVGEDGLPSRDELLRLAAVLEGKIYELKDELERRVEEENGNKKSK